MSLNLVKTIRLLPVALFVLFLVPPVGRADTVITNATYTLIVNNSNRVVQLLLSTNEFNIFAKVGYPTTADVRNLTTRIYTHFNDQFDFLIFISDQDTVPSGKYFGLYFEAKNDIAGIGYRIFDSTAYYGSTGALQGTIHLTAKNGLKGGPSLHEICHRWWRPSVPPRRRDFPLGIIQRWRPVGWLALWIGDESWRQSVSSQKPLRQPGLRHHRQLWQQRSLQ